MDPAFDCAWAIRGAGPAQVSTSDVFRMRKSAVNGAILSKENRKVRQGQKVRLGVNLHALVATALTRDDPDAASRNVEMFREEGNERRIRGAIDRWSGEPDDLASVALASKFSLARSGYDADVENHPMTLRKVTFSSRSRASCSRTNSSVLRSVCMIDSIDVSISRRFSFKPSISR